MPNKGREILDMAEIVNNIWWENTFNNYKVMVNVFYLLLHAISNIPLVQFNETHGYTYLNTNEHTRIYIMHTHNEIRVMHTNLHPGTYNLLQANTFTQWQIIGEISFLTKHIGPM